MYRRVMRACLVLLGLFFVACAMSLFAYDRYSDRHMAAWIQDSVADHKKTESGSATTNSANELLEKEEFYLSLGVWYLTSVIAMLLILSILAGCAWVTRKHSADTPTSGFLE